ncbi:MAG: septum formation protein Maf [Candidatus Dormibacteraeota bacterium]|nr:septum formation protein Maf [Candidatus Dormibacteraeota bacterium]
MAGVGQGPRLVLASGSPRREELLREAGYTFEVRPSGIAEPPYRGGDPALYAESLARAKAAAAVAEAPGLGGPDRWPPIGGAMSGEDEIILAADTVVALDGEVLGKPRDPDDAAAMLRRLSGRTHRVITAVATNRGGILRWGHAATEVTFRELTPGEIVSYVGGGEPLDKAGAYAIQGGAAGFVERMDGDRDTVIGLPMTLVRRLLALP